MKRVDIISKIAGRDSSGKPVGGGVSIPMGNYALKSDFELLKSMFNDFLEGDDTDSVINRWKDLEAFLNGISEEDPLTSILGNYIPIKGYTEITGEKNFTGGLKVNGSPIYYDTEKKYWKLEGDLLVTGGVTMYGNDSDFVASTIMDAIAVDGTTISKDGGILKVIGGTGGGISSVTSQMIVDALGYTPASATALRGYLPLSGGTLTGTLAVINEDVSLCLYRQQNNATPYIRFAKNATTQYGELGVYNDGRLVFWPLVSSQGGYGQWNTVWHSGNDGSGSGLDADLLDGYDSSYIMKYGGNWTASTDTAGIFAFGFGGSSAGLANNYGAGIQLCNAQGVNVKPSLSNNNANWYSQLLFGTDNRVYARFNTNGGGWSSQNKIAYVTDNVASATRIQAYQHNSGEYTLISGTRTDNTFPRSIYDNGWALCVKWQDSNGVVHNGYIANLNDNVASATKLQIARTIWGQSFDGTGNVSGKFSFDSNHYINTDASGIYLYNVIANTFIELYDNKNIILHGGNVGVGTPNPSAKLHIEGVVFANMNTESSPAFKWNKGGSYWGGIGYNGTKNCNEFGSVNADNTWANADTDTWKFRGNVLSTGGVTMYSDARKKTILNYVVLSLQQVANAPLIEHYYNSDKNKTTHVGSIAQYWAEMNDWFCKKDSEGYYTMEIQNAALASAISVARELVKFETETDRRIRLLEDENKRLKDEVEQLKWNIA